MQIFFLFSPLFSVFVKNDKAKQKKRGKHEQNNRKNTSFIDSKYRISVVESVIYTEKNSAKKFALYIRAELS
jgi:hypothetical protein